MMSAASLSSELASMSLFGTELEACQAWGDAFETYFSSATSAPVLNVPVTGLATAKAAMVSGLTGLSTAGAAALTSGVTAFWAALVATPATYFPTAILLTPPPGLAGLTASLTSVFAANIAGSLSKEDAMDAIATAIHTVNLGGTVTFPGAPPVLENIL